MPMTSPPRAASAKVGGFQTRPLGAPPLSFGHFPRERGQPTAQPLWVPAFTGMTFADRNGVRRGYRDLGAIPVSECFDLDGVDPFEVFAVVCQDGEYGVDSGATDQQIEGVFVSPKLVLYDQQNGRCNGCRIFLPPRNLEIDHIVPRAKDGSDEIENLQLLCGACNSMKGSRTHDEFMVVLEARGLR